MAARWQGDEMPSIEERIAYLEGCLDAFTIGGIAAWWRRRDEMRSLEERIAYLEGRMDARAATIGEVRDDLRGR